MTDDRYPIPKSLFSFVDFKNFKSGIFLDKCVPVMKFSLRNDDTDIKENS